MSARRTVEVLIRGDAKQAMAELERLAGTADSTSKSMGSKIAAFATKASLAVGAAGIAVAGFSVKMADDFEVSHARLMNAVSKTDVGMKGWSSTVKMTDSQLENFGFTNAQTENAMARLVPVTKNSTQAMGLMTLAADIARARHLDLESATQLLVKVQTGHVALLGRLGIATKDLTGHTISQQQAIEELAKMYGGSAQRNAETFGGKVEVLKARLTDVAVKIGQALIPILEKLVGWISKAISWFEKHKTVAEGLAIALGTVATAILALRVVASVTGLITAMTTAMTGAATATSLWAGSLEGAAAATGGADAAVAGMGATFAAAALPVAALAAAVLLPMKALGFFDAVSSTVNVSSKQLTTDTLPQLTQRFHDITGTIGDVNQKLAAGQAVAKEYGVTLPKTFDDVNVHSQSMMNAIEHAAPGATNQILQLQSEFGALETQVRAVAAASPVMAQKLIDAAAAAGVPQAELQRLVNILAQVPGQRTASVSVLGLGAATANAQVLLTTLGQINSQSGVGVRVPAGASAHYSPFGVFLGYYDQGGVVPGPIGKPGLAVVHGGERVLTPAQQAAGAGGGDVVIMLDGQVIARSTIGHINNGSGPKIIKTAVKGR